MLKIQQINFFQDPRDGVNGELVQISRGSPVDLVISTVYRHFRFTFMAGYSLASPKGMFAMETIIREIKRTIGTQTMPIGKLAELTSCNVPTIRYYEEIGLLPTARRSASGHRVYVDSSIELLTFIRHCRDFGFTLDNIRDLIAISESNDQDCGAIQGLAIEHLESIRTKISELQALEVRLTNIVDSCSDICCGGPALTCSILKDIVLPKNQRSSVDPVGNRIYSV